MRNRIRKFLILLISSISLVAICLFATGCFYPEVKFYYTKIEGKEAYELTECWVRWAPFVEDKTINVPSTYKGLPVVGIGEDCFNNEGNTWMFPIEKIYLPSTLTYIKNNAFTSQSPEVYIEDLTAWFNIEFESPTANPLNGIERYYSLERPDKIYEWDYIGKNKLFLNGEMIEDLVVPDGVKQIKDYAFAGYQLKSLTISDTVEEIGVESFACCGDFGDIVIPNSVVNIKDRAFIYNNATNVSLGNGVKNIEEDAFFSYYIAEVVNKSSFVVVEKGSDANGAIGLNARGVYNAEDEYLGSKIYKEDEFIVYNGEDEKVLIKAICDKSKSHLVDFVNVVDNFVVPQEITTIGIHAFSQVANNTENNLKIKVLTLPKTVKVIENYAFEFCYYLDVVDYLGTVSDWVEIVGVENLTNYIEDVYLNGVSPKEITIPEGVQVIKKLGFRNFKGLEKVILSSGVEIIEEKAFENCFQLKTVSFVEGLKEIGNYAFFKCKNLSERIEFPKSLVTIGNGAFSGCVSIVEVTIPGSVSIIGSGAFRECIGIEKLNLEEGIEQIYSYAFEGCVSIKGKLQIPSSVYSLGEDAFWGCESITEVNIPVKVHRLRNGCFARCLKLTTVKYMGTKEQWSRVSRDNWCYESGIKEVDCLDGISFLL